MIQNSIYIYFISFKHFQKKTEKRVEKEKYIYKSEIIKNWRLILDPNLIFGNVLFLFCALFFRTNLDRSVEINGMRQERDNIYTLNASEEREMQGTANSDNNIASCDK